MIAIKFIINQKIILGNKVEPLVIEAELFRGGFKL